MPDDPVPVDLAGATHVGGRDENQDRFAIVEPTLAVLSDGMGGHFGGALAAQLSVDATTQFLKGRADLDEDEIRAAFEESNERVRVEREKRVEETRMGATLTVAVPAEGDVDEWLLGHVGDSPAYLVTSTMISQITDDHTVAGELVRNGAITGAAAAVHPQRHVLLRAIGVEDSVTPDIQRVHLDPGNALVLVSDGVSDVVALSEVREIVCSACSSAEAAEALVTKAVELESTDNCTAVVVRRLEEADRMKVMIATDGSASAIEASERAVKLLRPDAKIILLTVVPDYEDPMETAGGIEGPALTEQDAEREYREHIEQGQDALRKTAMSLRPDVEVRLAPAETEPGHAIVAAAQEVQPDMIVIGASGKRLFRRLFTGSVSDYVVHHAPCPVLVVRHDH